MDLPLKKPLALVLAALVLAAIAWSVWTRYDLPKQAATLTTTYAVDTALYARDTLATDTAITNAGPVSSTVVEKVHRERKSAVTAIKTSEKRVQNLERQLRPPRLKVFAEAEYAIPTDRAVVRGALSARLGLDLRAAKGTWVRIFRQQPIAGEGQPMWSVGVRQEFRIF